MPIILRSEKGEPLTHEEMDGNFLVARSNEEVVVDLQSELVIPATLFAPQIEGASDPPFYEGVTNGSSAQTFASIRFVESLAGSRSCGFWTKLPDFWGEREVEVYMLGASHGSSLPFPQDYRLRTIAYPGLSGGGLDTEQTLTFDGVSVGTEQLLGTFTPTASAGLHMIVQRNYDHEEDSGIVFFFAGIILRLAEPPSLQFASLSSFVPRAEVEEGPSTTEAGEGPSAPPTEGDKKKEEGEKAGTSSRRSKSASEELSHVDKELSRLKGLKKGT